MVQNNGGEEEESTWWNHHCKMNHGPTRSGRRRRGQGRDITVYTPCFIFICFFSHKLWGGGRGGHLSMYTTGPEKKMGGDHLHKNLLRGQTGRSNVNHTWIVQSRPNPLLSLFFFLHYYNIFFLFHPILRSSESSAVGVPVKQAWRTVTHKNLTFHVSSRCHSKGLTLRKKGIAFTSQETVKGNPSVHCSISRSLVRCSYTRASWLSFTWSGVIHDEWLFIPASETTVEKKNERKLSIVCL